MKTLRSQLNVPNILSVIRLLLIPLFMGLYLTADDQDPAQYRWAAAVLLFSGLTDIADGVIARKFNLITPLGKILDPVADKFTQAAVCLCLTLRYNILLFILIFFIVKELTMLCAGAFLIKKSPQTPLTGSRWFGKLSTFIFHVFTLYIICMPNLEEKTVFIMLLIAAGFTLFSFIMYIPDFFKSKKALSDNDSTPKLS
ncbi:MAG: CDP-alcohol phosphatidyltransferase family protein [Oscillospiraceae bacterium]|nr:CDP-alcohol phosphatidyltransferase family protein [Oscillospiraceae bacterium]